MAADATELDRLIEEGLTLYGQGDIDAALVAWEEVLAVDPDNAQATSYVDYVRMNYELLTSEPGEDPAGPFGIGSDEPEYQIEIVPGELEPPPPGSVNSVDEGWFIGEESGPPEGLELPEPAPSPTPRSGHAGAPPREMMSLDLDGDPFEDSTREYGADAHRDPAAQHEFAPEATPGFDSSRDVVTFSGGPTSVRPRDTGFVKATPAPAPPAPADDGLDFELAPPDQQRSRGRRSSAPPPDFQITLRTPSPKAAEPEEFTGLELPAPADPLAPVHGELITSLPAPRRAGTKDLPSALVPPVQSTGFDDLELGAPGELGEPPVSSSANTRELDGSSFARPGSRDFTDRPTKSGRALGDPMLSAPTRELGLRPPGSASPIEDLIPIPPRAQPNLADPSTRHDIVLPFDPIDARSAQILSEVDDDEPATESRDDKTRRRITALLEYASRMSEQGEVDRAVAAVDLALSEEPNSVLAQKLIQRNRAEIMALFQTFLGDLERQPQLTRPLHELATAPISPRAAFLLSRIDGMVSLDEILDVSGMPRLEAYRYLCQLFLRGILR